MPYTNFINGFNITTKSAIDKRLYLTKAEMLQAETLFPLLPDVYFAICPDDGKLYLYNKNNTPNSVTGKYILVDEQVLNSERFTTLETKVGDAEHGLVKDVTQIQGDVAVLQTNVTELRTDVDVLKPEVARLKEEVEDPESGLAKRILQLEGRLDDAETRMTEIEERIAAIKLENIPGTLDGGVVTEA